MEWMHARWIYHRLVHIWRVQTTPAFTAQALAGGSSMRSEKQACGMRSSPPAAGLKTLSRARRRRTAAGALASADG